MKTATQKSISSLVSNLKKAECFGCCKKYPRFLFKKLPEGWYSRSGYNYKCRVCSFSQEERYVDGGKGKMGKILKSEPRTIKQRSEEFINHDTLIFELLLSILYVSVLCRWCFTNPDDCIQRFKEVWKSKTNNNSDTSV